MRGRLVAILLAATAAAFAAPAAFGKENVEAALDTPIPPSAFPGGELEVAWTLVAIDEQGNRRPFGAGGVFIKLFSASGGKPTIGFAEGDGGRTGKFRASVLVPEGGIGALAIGLAGISSGPTGTSRSDVYLPVRNSPFPVVTESPSAAPQASAPAASTSPSAPANGRLGTWMAVLALLFLLTLGSLGVLLWRRRHATSRAHPKLL